MKTKALAWIISLAVIFLVISTDDKTKAAPDRPPCDSERYSAAKTDQRVVITDSEKVESLVLSKSLKYVGPFHAHEEHETEETSEAESTEDEPAFADPLSARMDEFEARLDALERQVRAPKPKVDYAPKATVSSGSTGSSPVVNYVPRWTNYDGLTRREHAATYHGLDTATMSDTEIAMQLDADHDRHGGGHPAAMRSTTTTTRTRTRSTTNCPGGVCPTSRPKLLNLLPRNWGRR